MTKQNYYTQNKNTAKKHPQLIRKLRFLHKRGQEECKNQRVGRNAVKYASSGSDLNIAYVNSPSQDLHRIKPVKAAAKEVGGAPETPSLAEEPWAVDGC